MIDDDYLFKAADTVRRKSMAALETLLNARALAKLHASEGSEPVASPDAQGALVLEIERAIDMSRAALEELTTQRQKENTRDG